jgi:general secretion pathway protein H
MRISVTGRWTDALRNVAIRLINMAPKPNIRFPAPSQAQGFSLLELLVVVFIIGILATIFTLSVGVLGSDPELDKETDRLQALLSLALEEAVMHGRELGVNFYPDGYEFATFQEDFIEYYDADDDLQDQSEWIVLGRETLFGPRVLPEGIVIELEIDGRLIVLKDKKEPEIYDPEDDLDQSDKDLYRPQIWLYSTGDMNPFVITFRREFSNDSLILEFSEDGTAELSEG